MLLVTSKYNSAISEFGRIQDAYLFACSGSIDALLGLTAADMYNTVRVCELRINGVMQSINDLMTKSCVASVLPIDANGAFAKVVDAIQLISSGAFFDSIMNDIIAIPLTYTCNQLQAALVAIRNKLTSILSGVEATHGLFSTFETLMDSISSALSTIGALVGCAAQVGTTILRVENIAGETNPTLQKSLRAVREATSIGGSAGDISSESKNRITVAHDFDTQVTNLMSAFDVQINLLSF